MSLSLSRYSIGTSGGGGGGTLTNADNGTSLAGTIVQLGQPVGAVGNPAILLTNREIPLGGFNLNISNTANTKLLALLAPTAKTITTPFIDFQINGAPVFGITSDARSNMFLGVGSGNATMNSDLNYGFGNRILVSNTTGSFNIGIGDDTLGQNTTGSFNIALGWAGAALGANTTGSDNIAMGTDSQSHSTTGSENITLGSNTLKFNNGTSNVVIGALTIQSAGTIAMNNTTVIGSNSFTHGNSLPVPGPGEPVIGDGNTSVGARIGSQITNTVGIANVFVGFNQFGINNGPVGDNNVFVGANINNATAITGSNTVILGEGINTDLSNVVVIGRADQNTILGLSTVVTDSGHRLQVNGTGFFSDNVSLLSTAGAFTDLDVQNTIGSARIRAIGSISGNNPQAAVMCDADRPVLDLMATLGQVAYINVRDTTDTAVDLHISHSDPNGGLTGTNIIFADGRVSGTDAVNPNEFITLQQFTTAGSGFVLNQTTQQATSNFNISGTGVIGGDILVTGNTNVQGTVNSTANTSPASPTNSGVALVGNPGIGDVVFYDSTKTAGNRTGELIFFQGALQLRFKNDAGNTAIPALAIAGGQASGITGITSTSGSGSWAHTGAFSSTTNISAQGTISALGTGVSAAFPAVTTTGLFLGAIANNWPTELFVDSTRTTNNRVVGWQFITGAMQLVFWPDAGTGAGSATPFRVTGGSALGSGITSITTDSGTGNWAHTGGFSASSLAGTGTRMVVASSTGVLSAQVLPVISASFSQVGAATTVFTVTIGSTQPNNTYKVNVTPTSALSAALFFVTNKTTTTFTVTYLAGLTGTVTFDWALFQ